MTSIVRHKPATAIGVPNLTSYTCFEESFKTLVYNCDSGRSCRTICFKFGENLTFWKPLDKFCNRNNWKTLTLLVFEVTMGTVYFSQRMYNGDAYVQTHFRFF